MALKTAPNPTMERLQKALTLQKTGDFSKAQRLYKQVLKKNPTHADANHLLGVTYRQLGQPIKAVKQIEKAINLAGDRGPFYSNLARAMSDIPGSDHESILAITRRALDLDPSLIDAWNLHAISLYKLDMEEEAEIIFQRLISDYPDHPDAYRNYGVMLRETDNHDKAIVFFSKCVLLNPDNPEYYILLSKALQRNKDLDKAYTVTEKALQHFPEEDELHHQYARICFAQGNGIYGLESAEFALKADPNNSDRMVTHGVCLLNHRRYNEAIKAFKRSISLVGGEHPSAEWNMSLAYLGMGDLKNGWASYSARLKADNLPVIQRKFERPAWAGEDLKDKTIMIYAEQGVGDALRASTILKEVIADAEHVIIEGSAKLLPPFEFSFPDATVRLATFESGTMEATTDDYDCHTSLGDLQCYYRPTIASFQKARFPCLQAPAERVRELFERLPDTAHKPVVGISWRSRNLAPARVRNYFSVLDFAPILEVDDVLFLNLQYSSLQREITYLEHKSHDGAFFDFPDVDHFNDLLDAGAAIRCCDLVITAPTSVSDLAACHNVPCWSFGDEQAHFKLGQEVSPWYPAMTHTPITPEQTVVDLIPDIVDRLEEWKQTFSPDERHERLGF